MSATTAWLELAAADVMAGHTDLEIARHLGVSLRVNESASNEHIGSA